MILTGLLTASLAFVAAITPDAMAAYERPIQRIEISPGRSLNLDCRGTGAPTVILEAGWSSWSLDWAPVHEALARTTRVCAYDRAGMGFSDPSPRPASLASITADLDALLKAADVAGPYVLVGHSKSAVFVRAFAAAYPHRVAGLVLLDPASPELDPAKRDAAVDAKLDAMLRGCFKRAQADALDPDAPADGFCIGRGEADWSAQLQQAYLVLQRRPAYAAARRDELLIPNDALAASARRPGALGDRPLRVLTADQGLSRAIPAERRAKLQEERLAVNADLARLSTRGRHDLVARSGHMIMQDQPQAVIDAVAAVVAEVRADR